MKKTITLLFCAFICMHSYQQSTNQVISPQPQDQDLASTLIGVPENDAEQQVAASCNGKKIYLTKGGDNGVYANGNSFSYNAGDTLVLKAIQNPYSYVTLEHFNKGTDACPLVVINEGGQVLLTNYQGGTAIPGGFTFFSSSHVRVSGTGSSDKYGFKIYSTINSGVGIFVYGHSSDFIIDHLDIYKKGAGMWIKQEADCADSLQFPNWVINNFRIHDNRIRNIISEGMYLGSTDPNGTRSIVCNGQTTNPKPPRLGNFHIFNNIIDSTGRGAIQLSDADHGDNEINNNTITNIGFEFNTAQGNGVILGGYTHAFVHNNKIDYTYSSGIFSLGAGLVRIVNNTVDHSGTLAGQTTNGMSNIMIDTRNTSNPSSGQPNPVPITFKIKYNTLGANTDYSNNIRVYNTYLTYTADNAICSNTQFSKSVVNFNVATGVFWKTECSTGSVKKDSSASNAVAGKIGSQSNSASIFPNPATDFINLSLNNQASGKIALNIYDEKGKLLSTQSTIKSSASEQRTINISSLISGVYTLEILTSTGRSHLKFVKAK